MRLALLGFAAIAASVAAIVIVPDGLSFDHRDRIEQVGRDLLAGRAPDDLAHMPAGFSDELDRFVSLYPDVEVVARMGDWSGIRDTPENYPLASRPATHLLVFQAKAEGQRVELTYRLNFNEEADYFSPLNGVSLVAANASADLDYIIKGN